MMSVPIFFTAMIQQFFGMSPKFACRLWQHVDASPLLLWQLSLCNAVPASPEVWMARVKRLADVLTPELLMQASVTLSPEGKRRAKDCVDFEETLLHMLDKCGRWRW